jgi:hypothetical protein
MRIIPEYISQSVTVSTKTEAMLMKIKDKQYFIEYRTNLPPIPENLKVRGNIISEVSAENFEILKKCFEEFITVKTKKPWLHAPSYIYGYCYSQGLNLESLGILS